MRPRSLVRGMAAVPIAIRRRRQSICSPLLSSFLSFPFFRHVVHFSASGEIELFSAVRHSITRCAPRLAVEKLKAQDRTDGQEGWRNHRGIYHDEVELTLVFSFISVTFISCNFNVCLYLTLACLSLVR